MKSSCLILILIYTAFILVYFNALEIFDVLEVESSWCFIVFFFLLLFSCKWNLSREFAKIGPRILLLLRADTTFFCFVMQQNLFIRIYFGPLCHVYPCWASRIIRIGYHVIGLCFRERAATETITPHQSGAHRTSVAPFIIHNRSIPVMSLCYCPQKMLDVSRTCFISGPANTTFMQRRMLDSNHCRGLPALLTT